jgi:hypothetical protein
MKRYLLLLVTALCFWSCDDGDIIVSDFNFDSDSALTLCEFQFENSNQKVLHIVTESNEAISFRFSESILDNIDNIIQPDSFTIPISNNNRVNYRRLDASVDSEAYFCQTVPPSQPTVLEEFVSTTGGSVEFTISPVSDTDVDTDTDRDGIPDNEEILPGQNIFQSDSDEDGIPNFLDIDDDNDNIPTITEIGGRNAPDIDVDTDQDGIPNYLDDDDDGNGVITRYEDLNAFTTEGATPEEPVLNPLDDDTTGDGTPNFLDPATSDSLVVDFFLPNTISRSFRITVVFNNITLQNVASDRTIRLNSQGFGFFTFNTDNEVLTPR